jgi:hypothetical protein
MNLQIKDKYYHKTYNFRNIENIYLNAQDFFFNKSYQLQIKKAEDSLRFRLNLGVKAI